MPALGPKPTPASAWHPKIMSARWPSERIVSRLSNTGGPPERFSGCAAGVVQLGSRHRVARRLRAHLGQDPLEARLGPRVDVVHGGRDGGMHLPDEAVDLLCGAAIGR